MSDIDASLFHQDPDRLLHELFAPKERQQVTRRGGSAEQLMQHAGEDDVSVEDCLWQHYSKTPASFMLAAKSSSRRFAALRLPASSTTAREGITLCVEPGLRVNGNMPASSSRVMC